MGKKILVVEDDAATQLLISGILQHGGYKVHCASSGREGLELMESQQPDMVILDILLPDMNGLAVCKRIRQNSRLPILMLSAKNEGLDRVVGMEFGADDYLGKPFDGKELLARVRAQLRRWCVWQAPAPSPALHEGGMVARQATLLYVTIWNYDALSESQSLKQVTEQVSQLYEIVEPWVEQHRGVVKIYSEDTVVAIFENVPEHKAASDACQVALLLQECLDQLNAEWQSHGLTALAIGMGIHSGEVLQVDVSLTGDKELALVGAQAIMAASIANLTPELSAKILLSRATSQAVGAEFSLTSRGEFVVQAGEPAVELFELAGKGVG